MFDSLYPWQNDALNRWNQSGRRGIVEAVTGSGKTMVGVAAIADTAQKMGGFRYLNPLVVVPSTVLMDQWYDRLTKLLPHAKIGRISKDYTDSFAVKDVCIGIVNSVVRHLTVLYEHTERSPNYKAMLIADECHHYIHAPVFGKVLKYPFHYTLGLSATAATEMDFYQPGLGSIIKEYKFEDAGRDGLVPRFDLINASTHLAPNEKREYLDLSEQIKDQMSLVYDLFSDELAGVPDHLFFRKLRSLMMLDDGTHDPVIRRLFGLIFKRTSIIYQAKNKLGACMRLIVTMLNTNKKVMVFFERIESTEEVSNVALATASKLQIQIAGFGVPWCKVYHSGLTHKERDVILEEFRQPGPKVLLSCRSLDEGLDIPEVDCAILAASTQSRRQRIQRIGRVLRRGDGDKKPIVVTLFVEGTGDESVTAEDADIFKGVATIHQARENEVFGTLEKLLNSQTP